MNRNFSSMGEHAINWDNVLYVKRAKLESGGYVYNVYLIGLASPLDFYPSSPEGRALANWWENYVIELGDGAEGIPIA